MIIQTSTIGWVVGAALTIGGSFAVNYAQIQVNSADIDHSEQQNKERYDNIQKKLDSIENFLREDRNSGEANAD